MAEPSSRLSFGRHDPALSPSILDVEGDMPSTSAGKGPFTSPEVPTTDHLVYPMDKLYSYLDTTAQCLVRVLEMPSRKFNNEQCEYLVGKLKVILEMANSFFGSNLTAQPEVIDRNSKEMTRCIEVFKLSLALSLEIENFIQSCCKDKWLQAAMTLTNTAEYVASLGFNLELCRVYFRSGWTATKALTATQVDRIDREEAEIVKRKAWQDEHVLLDKVILELPSFQGEDKDLEIFLLQRLERVKPVSTSLSPESTIWSAFDDLSIQGRILQMVRQTEQLEKGASATVHKAVWLGIPVAKKTFHFPDHPDSVREVQILRRLCHPNVMSMFCCAMDSRKCSIVMELMDEDLHSFMEKRLEARPHSPPFSVLEAVDVILQIGEGVNYLHQNGIVHRDLKSSNILVKHVLPPDLEVQYMLIKVADFGLSKIKERSTRYSNQSFNIGTYRWMPPEVIKFRNNDGQSSTSVLSEEPKYPKKSDVYSFGMVCYEVLTGDVPFPHEKFPNNIKEMVLEGERPPLPDYCPSSLKALIEACWDPKPTHRPSFGSICLALKHLKCLLMNGFNSNEDFYVITGEPLPMSPEITPLEAPTREINEDSHVVSGELLPMLPENTPFETPTREVVVRRSSDIGEPLPMSPENSPFVASTRGMVVRKRQVQGGLVKSLFTVWRRPFRIFILHAGGPNGPEKNFTIFLHQALLSHRWSRSKFHVKPFLDVEDCPKRLSSAGIVLEELARFDLGLVVVTPDFFERHWPMTELIKFVEVQRKDHEGRMRLLPLFYKLMPEELRQGLDEGRWEQYWVCPTDDNHPLQLQECRHAVSLLCGYLGILNQYSEKRDYDNLLIKAYIEEILKIVDEILCKERSYAADLHWAMSLLQRN